MKYKTKFYYQDEQKDEVVDFKIKKTKIDENYKYVHNNFFYKMFAWLTYRFIATPIAFFNCKIINRIKIHNKQCLKQCKNSSYFIYANHTNQYLDGFAPGLICFPKKPFIICNSDNVNIRVIGKLTRMWGALPIPDTINATKNFYQKMEQELKNKNPILIYPEMHLWPYYTKIRNFNNLSFRYPIKYNQPVFTFTTIYKKKKIGKKPKIEIYIDGPFYLNNNFEPKIAQQELRDVVFNKMNERAKNSNYDYCIYERRRND